MSELFIFDFLCKLGNLLKIIHQFSICFILKYKYSCTIMCKLCDKLIPYFFSIISGSRIENQSSIDNCICCCCFSVKNKKKKIRVEHFNRWYLVLNVLDFQLSATKYKNVSLKVNPILSDKKKH